MNVPLFFVLIGRPLCDPCSARVQLGELAVRSASLSLTLAVPLAAIGVTLVLFGAGSFLPPRVK